MVFIAGTLYQKMGLIAIKLINLRYNYKSFDKLRLEWAINNIKSTEYSRELKNILWTI